MRAPAFASRCRPAEHLSSAAAGAQRWVRRYNGPGDGSDVATSIAVSPTQSKLFVTGYSKGVITDYDYATIGYAR